MRRITIDDECPSSRLRHAPNGWPCKRQRRHPRLRELPSARRPGSRRKGACFRR